MHNIKKSLSDPKVSAHLRRLVYVWILPAVTVISLLIVSGRVARPVYRNSIFLDFGIRVWVSMIFCAAYIMFSDLNRYIAWYYGGQIEPPVGPADNVNIIGNSIMSIVLGGFAMLISYWAFRTFFPISNGIALLLALLNGILIAAPVFSDRERIHL